MQHYAGCFPFVSLKDRLLDGWNVSSSMTFKLSIGQKHGNADALFRQHCHTFCKHCDQKENREKSQREAECASSDSKAESLKVATDSVVPAELTKNFPWTPPDLLEAQFQVPDIGPIIKWKNETVCI